jgi:hypothetical protein
MTGVELGLIQNRVLLNVTYSRNRSSNQLLGYALPSITGFAEITSNFPATVQNTIWEITLSTTNVKTKNIAWSTNINFTVPNNKLVAFPNIEQSSYNFNYFVGEAVGAQKALHLMGVDPQTGRYVFASKTDPFNPINPDDYTVLINPFPKFYGGIQNSLQYKGLSVDFLIQFVKQTGVNLNYGFPGDLVTPGIYLGQNSNQPVAVLDRWQEPGDIARVQKFSSRFLSPDNFAANKALGSDATRNVDASYIRLRNLSISWQIPNEWVRTIRLKSVRVYGQGQNLLTFTKYVGLDPENQSASSLPPLRMFTTGIQIGL